MRILKRAIIGVLSAAALTTGAITAFAVGNGSSAPQPTSTIDVKGLCDEAEHATDPQCAGQQTPEDRPGKDDRASHDVADDNGEVPGNDDGANHDVADDNGGANEPGEDFSGNCNESEHANDPQCGGSGVVANDDPVGDDHGGSGNDDGANHDADGDNGSGDSGPSDDSGPGSSGDDHSGSGSDEDNSGSGEDNFGSGSWGSGGGDD